MQKAVDKIWEEYDVDGSGDLDRDEVRKFLLDTLCKGHDELCDEAFFEKTCNQFDEDGSGTIDKWEMKHVIEKMFKGIPKKDILATLKANIISKYEKELEDVWAGKKAGGQVSTKYNDYILERA